MECAESAFSWPKPHRQRWRQVNRSEEPSETFDCLFQIGICTFAPRCSRRRRLRGGFPSLTTQCIWTEAAKQHVSTAGLSQRRHRWCLCSIYRARSSSTHSCTDLIGHLDSSLAWQLILDHLSHQLRPICYRNQGQHRIIPDHWGSTSETAGQIRQLWRWHWQNE